MLAKEISKWIKTYAKQSNIKALVVGVSGGIDSSVVSTLCAHTKLKVYALTMPIRQSEQTHSLSVRHAKWLTENFKNVKHINIDLTRTYEVFDSALSMPHFNSELGFANSRSRIRMMTLYQVAQSVNGIVVGTGNKVEDYGVGFYTKYGDGGIDIAPIADLYKTEVWMLGEHLGVDERIISAAPTDGLWDDGRTDTDQLGVSYEMLEWVMESGMIEGCYDLESLTMWKGVPFTEEQKEAIHQYVKFNTQNKHKMVEIPTFKL